MRRLTLLIVLGVLVCACAGRQRLYGGPPLPADQVALLTNEWGFWSERVVIVRIDNTKIRRQAYTYELELRPGPHVVEFGFDGGMGHSLGNVVLLLNAEAGHQYEARADKVSASISLFMTRGTWTGSIFDLTTQRTVVPTPPAPTAAASPTPLPR